MYAGGYGLGAGAGVPVMQPVLSTAGTVAGSIVGAAAAPGALTGAALAVPLIGAGIAAVTLAVTLFMNRLGPKQKVYTTRIVNEAEPLLVQNLDAWNHSDKTRAEQAQAVQNFRNIWASVVASCDRPELGNPGQACINDRKPGGKWDWESYYLTPILNDPDAHDVDAFTQAGLEISHVIGGGTSQLLLLAAGGLLLWAVAS